MGMSSNTWYQYLVVIDSTFSFILCSSDERSIIFIFKFYIFKFKVFLSYKYYIAIVSATITISADFNGIYRGVEIQMHIYWLIQF